MATLAEKLGVREGQRCLLDRAPGELAAALAQVAAVHRRPGPGRYEVVVLFAADRARLAHRWPTLVDRVAERGRLWVAWPKLASGRQRDLGERAVREFGLLQGLVDVKVCALDETWSGLAFARRVSSARRVER